MPNPFVLLLLPVALYVFYFLRPLTRRGLGKVPGPKSTSFLYGNLRELVRSQVGETEFRWYQEYGSVIRVNTPFGGHKLLISDPKALHHIFQVGGYQYPRDRVRRFISHVLFDQSLINVEGTDHRRQRRIMQPSFGVTESKALVPIFLSCADKMIGEWTQLLDESKDGSVVIDLPSWASLATLEAIGLAGFDYEFGSLDNDDNELSRVFSTFFKDAFGESSNETILTMDILRYLPTLLVQRFLRNSQSPMMQRIRYARHVSRNVCKALVEQKKEAVLSDGSGKDIMSLILKANASESPKAQLTEEEILGLMGLFILAGHETTANVLGWTAFELSKHPDMQTQLRQEIRMTRQAMQERGQVHFTAEDFDSMSYLTAVVKEVLRLHPPVPNIYRTADVDDVVPLSKPITLSSGEVVNELFVPKGTDITASVAIYNRIPEVFGEDSHSFHPDRWLNSSPPNTKNDINVGVYANLFTFSAGYKSCIGWRFALLEVQSFLVNIYGDLDLSLDVPAEKIRREYWDLMIPSVEGEVEKGRQLPVRVRIAS